MPLQKLKIDGYPTKQMLQLIIAHINYVSDHANDLEARLAALEHPVERLSEETAPKCNCMVVSDKRLCPQHDNPIIHNRVKY